MIPLIPPPSNDRMKQSSASLCLGSAFCRRISSIDGVFAFLITKDYGILHSKGQQMEELEKTYESCNLCPNHCGVNRLNGELGVCRATSTMRLAWAGLHRGEEPPISGKKGSGMLFFSGCSLHCRYCQNFQISDSAIDS